MVGLLRREAERKKLWDEFWKRQNESWDIIPTLIRWGRHYFSLIYVGFVKRYYKGTSILEIGSGSGESTLQLARENSNIMDIILLDFAFQSMRVARKKAQKFGVNANFIIGDIHFLPLKHESLEFVWNLGLLEHFEDPIPIVKEMIRVTRTGGQVAGVVPYKYAPIIILALFLKPFTKITKGFKEFQTWEEARQLWNPTQYREKFEMTGLKHVKVQIILGTFLLNIGIIGTKFHDCNDANSGVVG